MRRVQEGEVPPDGGTAVQENADRPVFRGNGAYDYVCVEEHARGRNGSRVHGQAGENGALGLPVNIAAEVPVEMARRRR